MQKLVLSLDIHEDKKCKKRVMKMASSVPNVDSISLDVKEKKLTLIGNMDTIEVVTKLRKAYQVEILTLGAAKEPEKPKEEPKNTVQVIDYTNAYSYYPPPLYSYYYYNSI